VWIPIRTCTTAPAGQEWGGQRPLCGHRRRYRLARLAKRNEKGVAFGADLVAVELDERGSQ
jgi:hypothetical protein